MRSYEIIEDDGFKDLLQKFVVLGKLVLLLFYFFRLYLLFLDLSFMIKIR